jgi:hypothetical protein
MATVPFNYPRGNHNLSNNDLLKKTFIILKKKEEKMKLSVISFNVEDFTVQPFHPPFCKNVDILLVQEWNYEKGVAFVSFLGANYNVVSVDRVAIIFNTNTFMTMTETHDIQLQHEDPKKLEFIYTKGRVKSNMLSILKLNGENTAVAVINCHLTAFRVKNHPHFHRTQMTHLFKRALEIINTFEKKYQTKCNIVIGGDTNYRKGKNTNLLRELFPSKYRRLLNDVCGKIGCNKTPTQFFHCVHEKNIPKQIVQRYFTYYPNAKDASARLDLLATTLDIEYAEVVPACQFSDHSAVRCILNTNISTNLRETRKIKRRSRRSRSRQTILHQIFPLIDSK